MIGYKFKLTNSASGEYFYINDFVTDPLRFIALQDYPTMDVDIRNSEVAKEGQHGIWDFFSFYGKRVITFSGIIVGENEEDAEDLKKQILRVISLPPIPSSSDDGYILITWTDANGDNWQISAKMQGYPRFNRDMKQGYKLNFTMTLKCKNPEIESQDPTIVDGVRGWAQGALMLPTLLPAMFDTAYNQSILVTNDGSIPAHSIITMYGDDDTDITNPYIYNTTTGKIFKVNITLHGSSEYIIVNSKFGTVVDQDGVDQSGYVDSTSEYIMLTPGDNNIVYASDESPLDSLILPTTQVTIEHRASII